MAYPPQFLDELRARLSLAQLVGRQVKLQKRGREYLGLCPFHKEKTPSFTVAEDKGFFHCFGCGAHGDVIGFVMRADGLGFPEAVERLAAEAGLEVPKTTPEERRKAEQARGLHALMEAACRWFEECLRKPEGREARDYLAGRGLDEATVARFRLGFAPDRRDGIQVALRAQGFSESELIEGGLVARPDDGRPPYDRFRGRVIFPITDRRGRVVAFGGRLLAAREGAAKYLNSPDGPLFHKGRLLYALDKAQAAAREGADVIVAEGYTDVIALHRAGFTGAVAPLGTALTESQIDLLWRLADEPVLCFDGDQAGTEAAYRAARRALPILQPGKSLKIVLLPKGEDPDSIVQKYGREAFGQLVSSAQSLVSYIWDRRTGGRNLATPERRAALYSELRNLSLEISDRQVQREYWFYLSSCYFNYFRPVRERKGGESRAFEEFKYDFSRVTFDLQTLAFRLPQVIILTMLNRVEVLSKLFEPLADARLEPSELEKLKDDVLAYAAANLATRDPISWFGLYRFLLRQPTGPTMRKLKADSENILTHAAFARPQSTIEMALAGLEHALLLYYKRTVLEHEIEKASKAFNTSADQQTSRIFQELLHRRREIMADLGLDDTETEGALAQEIEFSYGQKG